MLTDQDVTPTDARARMSTLGEILVYMAQIDQEKLREALKEQGRTSELIGDVLVRRGACQPEDVQEALAFQERFRKARTSGEAMVVLDDMQARARDTAEAVKAQLSFMTPPTNPFGVRP